MNARLLFYGFLGSMLVVSWIAAVVIWRAAETGAQVAPIDPRTFDVLTVVALGTGNEFENPVRLGPSTAVGLGKRVLLVDTGRAVAEALRSAAIPVAQPDTVLLTSLSFQSTVGLDDLLLTGWMSAREEPLRVIGPPGTAALAEGLMRAHAGAVAAGTTGLGLPESGARIEFIEAEDGWTEERDGLRITAGALPGGPTPGLAWRLESLSGRQRKVVVTGTGWEPDALVAFAAAADMWVHEAVYIPNPEEAEEAGVLVDPERLVRDAALHTSILDVGDLARRADVRHLVLTRMRPPPMYSIQATSFVSDTYNGEITVPEDGDELVP